MNVDLLRIMLLFCQDIYITLLLKKKSCQNDGQGCRYTPAKRVSLSKTNMSFSIWISSDKGLNILLLLLAILLRSMQIPLHWFPRNSVSAAQEINLHYTSPAQPSCAHLLCCCLGCPQMRLSLPAAKGRQYTTPALLGMRVPGRTSYIIVENNLVLPFLPSVAPNAVK